MGRPLLQDAGARKSLAGAGVEAAKAEFAFKRWPWNGSYNKFKQALRLIKYLKRLGLYQQFIDLLDEYGDFQDQRFDAMKVIGQLHLIRHLNEKAKLLVRCF